MSGSQTGGIQEAYNKNYKHLLGEGGGGGEIVGW